MRSIPEIVADHNASTPACIVRNAAEELRIEAQDTRLTPFERRYAEALHQLMVGVQLQAQRIANGLAYEEARLETECDEVVSLVSAMFEPLSNVVDIRTAARREVRDMLASCPEVTGPGSAA